MNDCFQTVLQREKDNNRYISRDWKILIKKLQMKMKTAKGTEHKNRIAERIRKARASLLAHILINS